MNLSLRTRITRTLKSFSRSGYSSLMICWYRWKLLFFVGNIFLPEMLNLSDLCRDIIMQYGVESFSSSTRMYIGYFSYHGLLNPSFFCILVFKCRNIVWYGGAFFWWRWFYVKQTIWWTFVGIFWYVGCWIKESVAQVVNESFGCWYPREVYRGCNHQSFSLPCQSLH